MLRMSVSWTRLLPISSRQSYVACKHATSSSYQAAAEVQAAALERGTLRDEIRRQKAIGQARLVRYMGTSRIKYFFQNYKNRQRMFQLMKSLTTVMSDLIQTSETPSNDMRMLAMCNSNVNEVINVELEGVSQYICRYAARAVCIRSEFLAEISYNHNSHPFSYLW